MCTADGSFMLPKDIHFSSETMVDSDNEDFDLDDSFTETYESDDEFEDPESKATSKSDSAQLKRHNISIDLSRSYIAQIVTSIEVSEFSEYTDYHDPRVFKQLGKKIDQHKKI